MEILASTKDTGKVQVREERLRFSTVQVCRSCGLAIHGRRSDLDLADIILCMEQSLRDETNRGKNVTGAKEELWLNLSRTAATVGHEVEQRLRPFGLSATQYNVLRILRGAGGRGLFQYEIRDRLVAQVPDVPRILERMEKAGWVARTRGEDDRRMVQTALTTQGRQLVEELDGPMEGWMDGLFQRLDSGQVGVLNELLVSARVRELGE